jgi:hypothetical protein
MKRTMIGVISGLAIWMGSALAAEAQQITPTGPMVINTGATGATYTADTTIPYLCDFNVTVYVYRGNNTTPLCWGQIYVYDPTSLTNSISFNATWILGAFTGEKFKFRAVLNFNGTQTWAVDKVITVTRPTTTTYIEPSRSYEFAMEIVDRDRRSEA